MTRNKYISDGSFHLWGAELSSMNRRACFKKVWDKWELKCLAGCPGFS